MSDQKINVVGTAGRYQMDQKNRGAQLVTQSRGVEDMNPYFSQIYTGPDGSRSVTGYGPRCIIQFLADVVGVEAGNLNKNDLISQRPTFNDCLPSTAVVEAVNQSLEQRGEWVQVPQTAQLAVRITGAGPRA